MKGELTTDGPADVFGETWEVNVKFVAPLGEIPKEFQPAAPKQAEQETTDEQVTTGATTEPSEKQAQNKLNVKYLALAKDAFEFEYKAAR